MKECWKSLIWKVCIIIYNNQHGSHSFKVERKVKSLHSQADDSFLSIRNALQVELVKLPKSVSL